ncbi:MAG: hypothetical protein Q4E89_07045 [Eubacteriales bacterium]|nr:hypothetical protein [Eubacteriales bacterium]
MRLEKIKWGILLTLLPVLTAAGVTVSYLTAHDTKMNAVGVGKNPIQIQEEFPEPTPTPQPGGEKSYKKVVTIANTPDGVTGFLVDCYVRAYISYNNSDIGKAVTLQGLDTANWVYNSKDGYYYYRPVLKEKERTTPLMTGFLVDPSQIERAYEQYIESFEINVYAESIGTQNYDSYQSAWEAYLDRKL